MTGAKSLSPFSYDWVGGDIWGLQRLEDECGRVAARLTDIDRALSRQVASVVGAGGWTGRAADAFTSAWDSDSKAGTQLAEAWDKIGEITGTLAASLAVLENALEEAAYQLEKQGIAVDTATGTPMPDVTAAGDACPSPGTVVARGKLASDYMAYRADILNKAAHARIHAAYALYAVTSDMLPPATDWGQLANDLDGVRGLWATPTTYRRELEEDFSKASIKQAGIIDEQWRAAIDGRKVNGDNFRMERDLVDKADEARQEVADLRGKLSGSPPESALTMAADGDAEGLGLAGVAGTAVKGIPFAGAAAGSVIQVYQDREDHESWRHALVDGVASSGASLGSGLAISAGVAGVIGSGTIVGVAAGTVVGGALAVGVGDFTHNVIQENWAADWHQHGVLDGTVHGVADSFDKTRHDMAHYGDDIKNCFGL